MKAIVEVQEARQSVFVNDIDVVLLYIGVQEIRAVTCLRYLFT